MNTPEYRKFKNGQEFMKILSDKMISVLKYSRGYRLLVTTNLISIDQAKDNEVSMESNEEEFNHHYHDALMQMLSPSDLAKLTLSLDAALKSTVQVSDTTEMSKVIQHNPKIYPL